MNRHATRDALLERHFTNPWSPVFALRNLSEEVKGALFARYSRSAKTLRELFMDEFVDKETSGGADPGASVGTDRAKRLYRKVLAEYGDDSVAQLGSAHVACEGVSNVLTKILERGRLMSHLEQSTRYVPYTDRPGGCWKYVTPAEIDHPETIAGYERAMDGLFETYSRWLPRAEEHFRRVHGRRADEDEGAYRRAVRAKALDTLRGLLPAATHSNLGIHGSGQAFEALLLRLRSSRLLEAHVTGVRMRDALEEVIPDFVSRLDKDNRGARWGDYLWERETAAKEVAAGLDREAGSTDGREDAQVRLIEHDPDGEARVVAAAAHPYSERGLDELTHQARELAPETREALIGRLAGERANRRHRPGRAFEHTGYLFEVTADYGAFRDLQRHRMLTMEWERLTTRHGRTTPPEIAEMGAGSDWERAMAAADEAHARVGRLYDPWVAQYAVPMACRIRFTMRMNAREAMHVLELRTQPAGHPAYRSVCQQMHRLIGEAAGHRAIAAAMRHVNHDTVGLERMQAEQRTAERKAAGG